MQSIVGRPPVHPALFLLGKAAFGLSWTILALRLAGFDLLAVTVPAARFPAAAGLGVATAIVVGALRRLGRAARAGLPHRAEPTRLATTGLYAVSRNPVYVGVVLGCASSCLYVPHWLNIAAASTAALVHHLIVGAEERFLRERFNGEWDAYRERVRRYL